MILMELLEQNWSLRVGCQDGELHHTMTFRDGNEEDICQACVFKCGFKKKSGAVNCSKKSLHLGAGAAVKVQQRLKTRLKTHIPSFVCHESHGKQSVCHFIPPITFNVKVNLNHV